ncbi:MAG: rRNA pseudouridine synthase, partial [Oscillospiraceae bacterium]|nr:rRNA pseudouridine synthase [Oscillospiraceae bacterium]
MAIQRLDNYIRSCGLASHRQAKALVAAGRVSVNGVVIYDSSFRCDSGCDIRVDGKAVAARERVCLMLNKSTGCISATCSDRHKTVLDLLGSPYREACLFPVGRLDMDSEGLLLITNDGELCRSIISPESKIVKEYFIETDRPFPECAERMFSEGIVL